MIKSLIFEQTKWLQNLVGKHVTDNSKVGWAYCDKYGAGLAKNGNSMRVPDGANEIDNVWIRSDGVYFTIKNDNNNNHKGERYWYKLETLIKNGGVLALYRLYSRLYCLFRKAVSL